MPVFRYFIRDMASNVRYTDVVIAERGKDVATYAKIKARELAKRPDSAFEVGVIIVEEVIHLID